MFKKIFFGIVLVVILAFGGLTYYISNLDWNSYKGKIADKFLEITGKEIRFDGKVNVSLLPQPVLIAENISVYNQGQNKKPLATIKKMETSVSLSSLLKGTPDVSSLSLSDAKVWVEQYENGKYNWSYASGEAPATIKNTNLHNLSLQNASFYYENKTSDLKFELEKVNADVQASAFDGPYRVDGNFSKKNEHFAIAVGVGSLASIDGIEINFSISHPATESMFRFDGTYNPQDGSIKGDFSGGSKKTAKIVNILAEKPLLNNENDNELQFSSGVELDKTNLKLSSFVTKYSDDIEGSGSVNYPLEVADDQKRQIDVKYEFLNVNLRHFYPTFTALYEKFGSVETQYDPDTDFNIKADLAAKHVDFSKNDTTSLENVTLKADWTDNIFTVEEFYASGAGDTSVSISGDLREENLTPRYFIKNSVISADFLSFANSFGANLQSYVQSTYRNADFDFSIVGDNSGFSIDDAELTMDKTKINADISVVFASDNPQIDIKATTDNFNFDNYLPDDNEHRDFWKQAAADAKSLAILKDFVFNLDFSAENTVFRSTPISGLVLNFSNNKGLIEIHELSMQNIAGATVSLGGNVDLSKEVYELADLRTDISAANINELISQTNFSVPSWNILKTKKFTMSAILSGNSENLTIETDLNADGIIVNYSGKAENLETAPKFAGDLSVKTTNTGVLLDGLNFEAKNIPNRNGALNCEGAIEMSSDSLKYSEAKCQIGTSEYRGDISFTHQKENDSVSAKINANEFNLAYLFDFIPSKTAGFANENLFDSTFISKPDFSRDNLNLNRYKQLNLDIEVSAEKAVIRNIGFDGIHFKLTNADNILKIANIDTMYKNAHYTGELTMFYANSENPDIKGNLKFDDVDIGLLGGSIYLFNNGRLTGTSAFESKGLSIYDFVNNISGYISITITDLNFKGFKLSEIQGDIIQRQYSKGLFQVIRDNLQRGETEFDAFDITIAMKNGKLTVANVALDCLYAESDLSFEIDLKDWKIESKMNISLKDVDVPPFGVSLNGSLQKPALELNIEDMVKKYDEHWKKIEEQEKAQKEAERRELNKKMDDAQKKLENLSEQLNSYAPLIEENKAKSKKEENIDWYLKKQAESDLINKELDTMKAKARTPDFSAEDIAKIEERIEYYEGMLPQLSDEIAKRYADDLNDRLHKLSNAKSDGDLKIQELKSDIEKLYDEKSADLAKIQSKKALTENTDIQQQKSTFNQACDDLLLANDELGKKLLPIDTISNLAEKEATIIEAENAAKSFADKLSVAEKDKQSLSESIKSVADKALNSHKKERSEPTDSALPETGLSTKAAEETAPAKTEGGLLRSINAEDEAIDNLSGTSSRTQGTLLRSYEQNTLKETSEKPASSGILKEVDGAVKKASGKIIVK